MIPSSLKFLRALLMALAVVPMSVLAVHARSPAISPREVVNADFDWKFLLGDPAGAETRAFDDHRWSDVQLPHDWSIGFAPDAGNPSGNAGGYYPAGIGWYRHAFMAPPRWRDRKVSIEFDGVYRNASVWLNGRPLGVWRSGYSSVAFDLGPFLLVGEGNVLAVRVDNSAQPASRWYSGSGIYRHVRLVVAGPVHVARWGVDVTSSDISDASARIRIQTQLEGDPGAVLTLESALIGSGGQVFARAASVVGAMEDRQRVAQELSISRPKLWSPESPHLYSVRTRLRSGPNILDEVVTPFGIRKLEWSATRGFVLNGQMIKLNGGSVHHDNGLLGAAAFDRAEERRVELLKGAGFNAVRTAHNVPSSAFLDACDRLGLLVLDEAFDTWRTPKVMHDFANDFDTDWRGDLDAMVLRDRNHPSVVIWSIGNEIPEVWTPAGAPIAHQLADYVRSLDATRPVTQAYAGATSGPNPDSAIAVVDIAGYNYSLGANHARDHERVPNRLMMTTESFPGDVFAEWKLAHAQAYVAGEFVWTAMDYLGESGIGGWRFGTPEEAEGYHRFVTQMTPMMANMGEDGKNPFPATERSTDPSGDPTMRNIFAGRPYHGGVSGDLDITGARKPQSYYREILWHGGPRIYVAVRRPAPVGEAVVPTLWSVPPAVASWTWPGDEGRTLQVEVYSGAERVRLMLNGRLLGERPTGVEAQRRALFDVPYESGELIAIALEGGKAVANSTLVTTGEPRRLRLVVDRRNIRADGQDLAYVTVEAIDAAGRWQPNANALVTLELDGPGTLAATGNADLRDDESYAARAHHLYEGRAMVVVRADRRPGRIALRASAPGLSGASVEIVAGE